MDVNRDEGLRYLDATRVDTPIGRLADLALVSPTDESLGSVDGVVINPSERKVCYLVVESGGWWSSRRYLLPLEPFRVDRQRKAVRVELEATDIRQLPQVHAGEFTPFGDYDLITALFAPQPAPRALSH
jgi:hypothetical protein